jgi:hypothetical protein
MIRSVRSTGTGVNRRLVRFLLRQLLPTYLPVNLKDLSPMTPIGQIHSIVEAKKTVGLPAVGSGNPAECLLVGSASAVACELVLTVFGVS